MSGGEINDAAERLRACYARHDFRELCRLERALRDHPKAEQDQVEKKLHDLMGIRQEPAQS